MRPSDRAIRDELRREAARVTIPDDMWDNIKQRLDSELEVAQRHQRLALGRAQWKPAVVFAAAAGIFWLTVIPISVSMDGTAINEGALLPSTLTIVQPDPSRNRQAPAEPERSQSGTAQSSAASLHDRTVNSLHFPQLPTRY